GFTIYQFPLPAGSAGVTLYANMVNSFTVEYSYDPGGPWLSAEGEVGNVQDFSNLGSYTYQLDVSEFPNRHDEFTLYVRFSGIGGHMTLRSWAMYNTPARLYAENEITVKPTHTAFLDVHENDWFYNAVMFAFKNGWINGTSATTFSPMETMTRAMMSRILWNNAGTRGLAGNQRAGAVEFYDVPDGTWYTDAVHWAAANGVSAGYGDGRFGPDNETTREEMTVMLYNYARFIGVSLSAGQAAAFADEAYISDWAKEAVTTMRAAGIVSGKNENIFDPQGKATRAEAAAMVQRFQDAVDRANRR
ncbi:MAG: S-layer homology domain-containing protein, partial [Defluviitaleaceae bacterium]|nr:S-layer homology domain-containing protein [Defluviitaleaceae bacterium]